MESCEYRTILGGRTAYDLSENDNLRHTSSDELHQDVSNIRFWH